MLDDAEGRGPSPFARSWDNGTDARRDAAAERSAPAGAEHIRGVIARQLWMIVIPILIVPALGFLAISRLPIVYTAIGTVIYDPAGYAPEVLQSILKTDPTTDTVVAAKAPSWPASRSPIASPRSSISPISPASPAGRTPRRPSARSCWMRRCCTPSP